MVQRNIERSTPARRFLMKFDPFNPWGQVFETWQKMAEESLARTNAFYAEFEKAEAKHMEQMVSAIDEMAKLQKQSIAYGAQLGAEWRKMSLDAFHKATTFTTSAAAA
jgi:hypothetical protein